MRQPRDGERLSAADASNVVMDARDQVNVFLMAGILGVGGFVAADGGIDLDLLRAAIAGRLADPAFKDLARFSQRVHGSVQWETCEPDLVWHVRLVGPVNGPDGLADLCGTLMTVPLPLDRPMWELLIVSGASPGGPGVILRVHHAVADGVAGVRLVQRLFGSGPSADEPAPARPVAVAPSSRRRWRTFVTGVSRVLAVFRATVPPTVLLGPIGAQRGVAFADVELPALARAAKAAGATINDALLAAAAVAAEATLRADGHPVPPVLPASVPVALPDRGTSGNAVGVMLVPLPTGESDAGVRLTRIAAATRSAKAEARAQGTYELTRTRWGSRLFAWLARRQRFIALFVTNVHGPDEPLRLAGAPLEHAWPVAPIQGNVRFGVAAMSYAGRFGVAVHVDAGALNARVAGRALGDELTRIAGRQ
jgi:diacylglycerol O-acyltransferase / wax synthase